MATYSGTERGAFLVLNEVFLVVNNALMIQANYVTYAEKFFSARKSDHLAMAEYLLSFVKLRHCSDFTQLNSCITYRIKDAYG